MDSKAGDEEDLESVDLELRVSKRREQRWRLHSDEASNHDLRILRERSKSVKINRHNKGLKED